MTKRLERTERTQAENAAGPPLAHLVEPMLAGMTSTRQHLLAWNNSTARRRRLSNDTADLSGPMSILSHLLITFANAYSIFAIRSS